MQINIYYFKSYQTLQWQGHVLLCICQHGNISKDSNNSYCTKLSSLCLYYYDQHVTRYYQHKLIQQKNIEENPINFSIPLLYSFYRSLEVCVLFMPSNSAYQFKKKVNFLQAYLPGSVFQNILDGRNVHSVVNMVSLQTA